MTDSENSRTPEELAAMVTRIGASFDRWWMEQNADLSVETVPEVLAHIWIHIRQHVPQERAARMFERIIAFTENKIREGDIILELPGGETFPFETAEQYEGREEMRDMLIAASRGQSFTDDAIAALLNEGKDGVA